MRRRADHLDNLEEHLEDDEDDDDPLELVGVRVVELGGEHVEEFLDDVEALVEHLCAPVNLQVLCRAKVERQELVVLPKEVGMVEDVRVCKRGRWRERGVG